MILNKSVNLYEHYLLINSVFNIDLRLKCVPNSVLGSDRKQRLKKEMGPLQSCCSQSGERHRVYFSG